MAFVPAPGQAREPPRAMPLPGKPPRVPGWVVADRGTGSHAVRRHVRASGALPVEAMRAAILIAALHTHEA